ncbi:hypothetical protein DV515_00016255, partial [Chloebia gouldiae]
IKRIQEKTPVSKGFLPNSRILQEKGIWTYRVQWEEQTKRSRVRSSGDRGIPGKAPRGRLEMGLEATQNSSSPNSWSAASPWIGSLPPGATRKVGSAHFGLT